MAGIPGFEEVPTLTLQILVIISAILQTILFCYHFGVHEAGLKSKWWIDLLALALCIFFIVAIVITSIGYEWCIIDLTIHSFENIGLQYIIYYIGAFMLLLGNILFIWIEIHLKKGYQSPWYNNDISFGRIDVNVIDLTVNTVNEDSGDEDEVEKQLDCNNDADDGSDETEEKLLVKTGPFKYCRHPIILIMLCWEFGYGLSTGAWFEFLAFVAFVSVELIHINTIEKSLLHKYGKDYYQYMENKNAFIPGICGRYCCELGVYRNSCVCLCLFNENKQMEINHNKHVLLN